MRTCGGSSFMTFSQKIRKENYQLKVGVGEQHWKVEKEEKVGDSHGEAMDNE